MIQQYKNYAFISYKRSGKDEHYAKWLQGRLEHYLLPVKHRNDKEIGPRISLDGGDRIPKRLYPVFLDKTNLTGGLLDDNLREAISQSKYLIVICSRNAYENSKYLDMEIQYFIESGHTPDMIIPFILEEECTQPEKECFPPALQKLNEQYEILGINLRDSDAKKLSAREKDAFLKIIATMMGIHMSAVKNLEKRLRIKHALTLSASIAAVLLCSFVLAVLYWNQHIRPHHSYYKDYVVENNIARGIYPIAEESLSSERRYYKFTTVDSKLRTVEYLNSKGLLVNQTITPFNEGSAKMEYFYNEEDGSGIPSAIEYTNDKGLPLVCCLLHDKGTRVERTVSYNCHVPRYLTPTKEQVSSPLGADLRGSLASKYTQTIVDGKVMQRLFAMGDSYAITSDLDSAYASVNPTDYIYGYSFTYDELGRVKTVTYVGTATGKTNGNIDGVNSVSYSYDEKTGALIEENNFDVFGNPALNGELWASKRLTLDDNGLVVRESYFGADGEPVITAEGYSSKTYSYDGFVNIGDTYYDTEGNPCAVDGYVSAKYGCDENYVTNKISFFDENDSPAVATSTGCHQIRIEYTKQDDGSVNYDNYTYRYYDKDLKTPAKGCQNYRHKVTKGDYYTIISSDLNENDEVICSQKSEYDPTTYALRKISYLSDPNDPDSLVDSGDGVAVREAIYNDSDQMTALIKYDKDGQEINKTTYKYDRFGVLETTQSKKILFDGVYGSTYVRDDQGRIIQVDYLDKNGKRTANLSGYDSNRFTYDETTDKPSSSTYYLGELPVMIDGYARLKNTYDEYGRLISTAYYDNMLKPVVYEDDGFARMEVQYDDAGNIVKCCYYGELDPKTGKQLYINNEEAGCAKIEFNYDEKGNIIAIRKYITTDGTDCIAQEIIS